MGLQICFYYGVCMYGCVVVFVLGKVYCIPDDYEVLDKALDDIKFEKQF